MDLSKGNIFIKRRYRKNNGNISWQNSTMDIHCLHRRDIIARGILLLKEAGAEESEDISADYQLELMKQK